MERLRDWVYLGIGVGALLGMTYLARLLIAS